MRTTLPLLLCLAACSGEDPLSNTFNAQAKAEAEAVRERAADNGAVNAGFSPAEPGPLENGVAVEPARTSAPGAILPPAGAEYRYLGKWAVSPALCEDGWWRFESRKLTTIGETSCDLPEVGVTQTGYELRGTCRSERRKTDEKITLSFDDARKRMHLEAQSLGPADLLYCGP